MSDPCYDLTPPHPGKLYEIISPIAVHGVDGSASTVLELAAGTMVVALELRDLSWVFITPDGEKFDIHHTYFDGPRMHRRLVEARQP